MPGSEGSEKSSVGEDSASPDHSSLEDPTMVSNDFGYDFGYVRGLLSPHASGNWQIFFGLLCHFDLSIVA